MPIHAILMMKLKPWKRSFVLTAYEKINFHGDFLNGDATVIYPIFIAA